MISFSKTRHKGIIAKGDYSLTMNSLSNFWFSFLSFLKAFGCHSEMVVHCFTPI